MGRDCCYNSGIKHEVRSSRFDIAGLCTAPANEQQIFCGEVKKVVGW